MNKILNRILVRGLPTSTASLVSVFVAGHASAQEPRADEVIREIVVTARRSAENIQTTPVAVTALDAQALVQQQVVEVMDLQRATPSLSIGGAGTGPSSIVYLAIRGNAQNSPNSASDAAVGLYVDGVYYGRPIVGNLGLLDTASAEVLRGTQGTLFGRNTTGGALNLTTTQPDNEFAGYARVGVGNYNTRLTEGAVTTPISDELSLRFAGRYGERDGYGSNPITGNDTNKVKYDYATRATLRFEPKSLPLVLTVSGDYLKARDEGTMVALAGVNPAGPLATAYPDPTQYIQSKDRWWRSYGNPQTGFAPIDKLQNYNQAEGVYATAEIDLGGAKLKSISAYRSSDTHNSADLDGTPARAGAFLSSYKQKQYSEELQLSGAIGDRLDWITGAFYFRESGDEQSASFILENATLGPGFSVNLSPPNLSDSDFEATSKAVFAQANYHITDKLRATAGVRYTWDSRSLNRHGVLNFTGQPYTFFTFPGGVPTPVVVAPNTCAVGSNAGQVNPPGGCNDPQSAKFDYPAWVLGLDYQINDDMFIYAKTGGAAMSGGFNIRLTPPGLDAFSPEKVRDLEAGFKGDFLDNRLRTNLAAFYLRRNGAQNIVNEFSSTLGLTQYVRNAGDVRAYGFEFEGTALPWYGMELTAAVGYLHSEYRAGSFVVQGTNGPVDRSDEDVPQAPEWTVSLGATHTFETSWGSIAPHLDYTYISERNYGQDTPDLSNPALTPAQRTQLITDYAISNRFSTLDGYGLLNGRLTFNLDSSGLELSVWGRNLANEKYNQNLFNSYTGLGFVAQYQGNPRTYGVTATLRF